MDTTDQDWERWQMWSERIPGYMFANRNKKKHLKEEYRKMQRIDNTTANYSTSFWGIPTQQPMVTLTDSMWNIATTGTTPSPTVSVKEEKEQNMCYDCDREELPVEKNYLISRLLTANSELDQKARVKFGLRFENPKTFNEAIERIKAGQYTVPKNPDVETWNALGDIIWRDPSVKEDKVSYQAFQAKQNKLYTAAMDTIYISEPAEGLKAVQDFEAVTVK